MCDKEDLCPCGCGVKVGYAGDYAGNCGNEPRRSEFCSCGRPLTYGAMRFWEVHEKATEILRERLKAERRRRN